MFHFLSLVVVLSAYSLTSIAAAADGDKPTPEETAAMQGAWKIESLISDGEPVAAETIRTWRRLVKNDRVTWKRGEETLVELSIQYNPRAKPMTMVSTIESGDAKGQTMLSIYELNGDELRVCFAPPGKPRPKEFSSTPGSGVLMYTARRIP
ncbi:MAG TPA: TIGR03067 domain-containing protein [Pirellulales bacterium]|nr:TIGR03067 domain-containing protein [Pirellulales bacterium]